MRLSVLRPLCVCLCVGAALLTGCASGPETQPTEGGGDIVLNVSGQATSARLSQGELTGPQVSVALSRDALRGRAYGAVLDLSLSADRVTGLLGGQQVGLQLERLQPQGFRAQGPLAGTLSNFTFTPEALDGQVGPCSYSLRRVSRTEAGIPLVYQGQRNCAGTRLAPTTLTLPPFFATTGEEPAQAALLGLMLPR